MQSLCSRFVSGVLNVCYFVLNFVDKIKEIKANRDGAGFIFYIFVSLYIKNSDYENIGGRNRICRFGFRYLSGRVGNNGDLCGCQ